MRKIIPGNILFRVLILLFVFLFPAMGNAQTIAMLRGVVQDAATKESIVGASVYDAADLSTGVISDINGKYELKLNAGSRKIICSLTGMHPDTLFINVDSNKLFTHTFLLTSVATELQTVVISEGKYAQRLEEITVSMEVLKPTLITNKNAANIKGALEQVPGLNILDGEPQIRGGSGFSFGVGSRVAILMDGLPALAGDAGRPEWNFIPVENVEQVEIIKGASSVTYGSAALSGSINIRTAYPTDQPVTKVNLSTGVYDAPSVDSAKWWKGTANFSNFSFLHSQKFGQLDLVFGGMGIYDHGFIGPPSYHSNLGTGNDTISESQVGEKTVRLNFNLRYRPKNNVQLNYGINGNFMQSTNNFSLVWDNDSTGIYRAFPKTMTLQDQHMLYLDPFINYYTSRGFNHSLRARYFYTKNALTNSQSNETNVIYSEYQFTKQVEVIRGLNITGGLVLNQTYSNAALYNNGISPENTLKNYAAYTQLNQKLLKILNVSLGAREEYFKMNDEKSIAKPILRTGLNVQLTPGTFLRYSYGQGYRFPSITEKFIRTKTGGLDVFPNPALQPESSWNTEIGIKQGFKINNFLGFIDVAAFWQEYANTIEFTYGFWDKQKDIYGDDSLSAGFKFINTGNTRVRGIDVSIAGQGKISDHWKVEILCGYTYVLPQAVNPHAVYAVDSTPQAMSYAFTSTDTSNSILKYRFQHIAKTDLQISYKSFSIGGSWRYFSNMQNIDKTFYRLEPVLHSGIESYRDQHKKGIFLFDVRAGVEVSQRLKISFIVNNAFNKSYSLRPLKIESPRTFAIQFSFKV